MLINIPLNNNLNFTVVKKKQKYFLIIFDKYIYIKYIFSEKSSMYILSDFNYINLKLNFFNKYIFFKIFLNNINNSINYYVSKKIIFSGKGYKLKKFYKNVKALRQKFISFYFNKSHINIIYFFNILIKKLKKTKLIFYSVNYIFFKNIINLTLKIKKFNIFTQKGLRLSRQLIYKKIGKKSS